MKIITTFSRETEYQKTITLLTSLSLPFETISPEPAYTMVGVPALIIDPDTRLAVALKTDTPLAGAGWVDYYPCEKTAPQQNPLSFVEDLFGKAAIMVLASCIADDMKIRFIAHTSHDISPVFPYLNVTVENSYYNPGGPTLTFMDEYRIITLYTHRIAAAKADGVVDAWRVLESIRVLINTTWAKRASIEPLHTLRRKPPALEIYKKLPKTNCGLCGEKGCMPFALKLWAGTAKVFQCIAVFEGEFGHLKKELFEIGASLGASTIEK